MSRYDLATRAGEKRMHSTASPARRRYMLAVWKVRIVAETGRERSAGVERGSWAWKYAEGEERAWRPPQVLGKGGNEAGLDTVVFVEEWDELGSYRRRGSMIPKRRVGQRGREGDISDDGGQMDGGKAVRCLTTAIARFKPAKIGS